MFEFKHESFTASQADEYLRRIGYDGARECSAENLNRLICLHQSHVPFENLDLFPQNIGVRLDAEALFDKIVRRKRGGICFELNGAFSLLLRAMGYDAYSCVCRVAGQRTELGGLAHQAVIVRLNGKRYLCDVGLGGAMAAFAVEICEKRQTHGGETFWVEPLEEDWQLLRYACLNGEVGNSIIFCLQPFLRKDFDSICTAYLQSLACPFTKHSSLYLKTADGYRRLREHCLTVKNAAGKTEREIIPAEWHTLLKDAFGLEISPITDDC